MEQKFDAAEMLGDLDAGVLVQKLSRVMAEVAVATCEHGRAGKVTLAFNMKQMGDGNQIVLTHSISKSKPTRRGTAKEDDTTATPMFVGPNGALSLMPFKQGKLFEDAPEKQETEQ